MVHHGRGLRHLLKNDNQRSSDQISRLIEALKSTPSNADVSAADQALIDYALKLTLTPDSVAKSDIENLRKNGFDDLAIHDLVCCVSYFAFVNRIADGLGVAIEPIQ